MDSLDWDDDISSTAVTKKGAPPPPRKGRRATNPFGSPGDDDIGTTEDLMESPVMSPKSTVNLSPPKGDNSMPVAPPRSRRSGVWGEEAVKSAKKQSMTNLIEQERFRSPDRGPKDDSDDDVPVIPDLDEAQEEDLATQVAQAPSVAVNRVATYKELDTDLLKHTAFATLDDIDLRLLTKCMTPESDIREPDAPWTWDILFTDVTSEIMAEWSGQEGSEKET